MVQLLRIAEVFFLVSLIFIKLSIGFFFLRLLEKTYQKRVIYSTMIVSVTIGTAYTFYAIFQCGVNVSGEQFWENILARKYNPKAALAVGYLHAVTAAIVDLTLNLLPIPVIRSLKIPAREKAIIYIILAMGALSVALVVLV